MPSAKLVPLHRGGKSDRARRLQVATRTRLKARGIEVPLQVDGVVGRQTLLAVRKAAWALGAESKTYNAIPRTGVISVGVQRLILNPGDRNDAQLRRAKARMTGMERARREAEKARAAASGKRRQVVRLAQQAAANYRRNPGAYHYLAGGIANLVFLRPTPLSYRSDCSQFVASVYKAAGLPSPAAPLDHQWASTFSIVKSPHARVTLNPKPGDLGMYGSRLAPHHVELYVGEPGQEFIGHGSPPIDSLTPGRPDFYLTFDFLD